MQNIRSGNQALLGGISYLFSFYALLPNPTSHISCSLPLVSQTQVEERRNSFSEGVVIPSFQALSSVVGRQGSPQLLCSGSLESRGKPRAQAMGRDGSKQKLPHRQPGGRSLELCLRQPRKASRGHSI